MKSLVFLFVCFPLFLFAQENKDAQKDKLKGKVKVVTEREYVSRKMLFLSGKESDGKTIYHYDLNGNETEVKAYRRKGRLDYKVLSTYDGKNKLAESLLYYSDIVPEAPDTKSIYKYDTKGNQTGQDDYNNLGSLVKKQVFRYDENGNQVEFISYGADSNIEYRSVNKFDGMGNKIREDYYGAKDTFQFKIEFKYDAAGRESEQEYFGPTNELAFKLTYKYEDVDKQGNWLKEIVYENDKTEAINLRKIEYY